MERKKIDLEVNKPTRIKLLFDDCVEGSSQYGKYYLYAIQNGNGSTEYSLFAPDQLHEQLKQYKKGDELNVTKIAAQRGSKIVVTYDVQKIKKNESTKQEDPTPTDSTLYELMEQSFDEAAMLQQKYNGINISQVGISLFIQKSSRGNQSYGRN